MPWFSGLNPFLNRKRPPLTLPPTLTQVLVDHALRKPCAARRGVRILAMDGGGMRGLATIEMVRALEKATRLARVGGLRSDLRHGLGFRVGVRVGVGVVWVA